MLKRLSTWEWITVLQGDRCAENRLEAKWQARLMVQMGQWRTQTNVKSTLEESNLNLTRAMRIFRKEMILFFFFRLLRSVSMETNRRHSN